LSAVGLLRDRIDTTTKCAESTEIRFLTTADLMGRVGLASMQDQLVKSQVVLESIWPELGWKPCSHEHTPHCICDHLMWLLRLAGRTRIAVAEMLGWTLPYFRPSNHFRSINALSGFSGWNLSILGIDGYSSKTMGL
jgi:hypothetical protein